MKKKMVSALLVAVTVMSTLTGCGSNGNTQTGNATEESAVADSDEGKVINIYSWNDEFRTRVEAVYIRSRGNFCRWNGNNIKRWNRDSLDCKSKSGWCISAEIR